MSPSNICTSLIVDLTLLLLGKRITWRCQTSLLVTELPHRRFLEKRHCFEITSDQKPPSCKTSPGTLDDSCPVNQFTNSSLNGRQEVLAYNPRSRRITSKDACNGWNQFLMSSRTTASIGELVHYT